VEAVRSAVAALGRGRTTRIAEALRARVLAVAQAERAHGVGWRVIATQLGVSRNSLRNWQRERRRAVSLVRVRVAPPTARAAEAPWVEVVSPRGYRVTGGDVATIAAVLRALE
jgi:transposase